MNTKICTLITGYDRKALYLSGKLVRCGHNLDGEHVLQLWAANTYASIEYRKLRPSHEFMQALVAWPDQLKTIWTKRKGFKTPEQDR